MKPTARERADRDADDLSYLSRLLSFSQPTDQAERTARSLLERFGSFAAIAEASADELMRTAGMDASSAVLFLCLNESLRRYAEGDARGRAFRKVSDLAEFLRGRFVGLDHEHLCLMLFDREMRLLDCGTVAFGSPGSSPVPLNRILEKAIWKHADFAVLSHNHPPGIALPSDADIEVTYQISEALRMIHVSLIDHLVISDDRFVSLMKQNYWSQNVLKWEEDPPFDFASFYDVDETTYRFSALTEDGNK